MPYSALSVANKLITLAHEAGRTVTPMQVLKLNLFLPRVDARAVRPPVAGGADLGVAVWAGHPGGLLRPPPLWWKPGNATHQLCHIR